MPADLPCPWADLAPALASHALSALANRTDAYGEHDGDHWRTRKHRLLDETVLLRHFAGETVIGLHAVGSDRTCRWIAFDIDAKSSDAAPAASEAVHQLRQVLDGHGIPFVEEDSNGGGGRHLWVFLQDATPVPDATRFAYRLAEDARFEGEVFPKGEPTERTPYGGGFLRLPGRHPGMDHWSRIRRGTEWLVGPEAAEFWLDALRVSASKVRMVLDCPDASRATALRGSLDLRYDGSEQKKTEDDRSEQRRTEDHRGEQTRTEDGRSEQKSTEEGRPTADDHRPTTDRRQKTSVRSLSIDAADRARIEQAILATVPGRLGYRQRMIFEFCRRLKAIPAVRDAEAVTLRPIIQAWHEAAKPFIGTQPFEDTWSDFLRAFPKARVPLTNVVLEIAATLDQTPDPAICDRFESIPMRKLVKLLVVLNKHHSTDGVFFLACRSVATAIEVGATRAADYLFLLRAEGYLELVDCDRRGDEAYRYRLGPAFTTCATDKQ